MRVNAAADWKALRTGRAVGQTGEEDGRGGETQRGANECHCNAVRGGAKNTY